MLEVAFLNRYFYVAAERWEVTECLIMLRLWRIGLYEKHRKWVGVEMAHVGILSGVSRLFLPV